MDKRLMPKWEDDPNSQWDNFEKARGHKVYEVSVTFRRGWWKKVKQFFNPKKGRT